MGLLKQGRTLSWQESQEYLEYVKEHGILQFLNVYKANVKKQVDFFKFGDEIEYMLLHLDHKNKRAYLSLRAEEVMHVLNKDEEDFLNGIHKEQLKALWRPEYGRYMIEGTPGEPYNASFSSILSVEENMMERRKQVSSLLKDGEVLLTLSMFPSLGAVKKQSVPDAEPNGPICKSLYISDDLINHHPRFGTLTKNIRERKGKKVCILSPLFMDKNTDPKIGLMSPYFGMPKESTECNSCICSPTHIKLNDKQTPYIHSDAMVFGMGCCCVQCTMSTRNIEEARYLYDQLLPVCPILLSLTAATPIVRGLLAETDVRWYIISGSVDDRTDQEVVDISKSRYDSVSLYLANNSTSKVNSDLNIKINQHTQQQLLDAGVDEVLAKHIAHLFIRDPLVVFDTTKEVNDEAETDHFENIQSTNWQSCRFKPPPAKTDIGWRVEFRVMETAFTDFENAAFVIFVVLLTRCIITFNLEFYMPLSKVDENMSRAHQRDSLNQQKFYFRKNLKKGEEVQVEEMTMDQIINGNETFVGYVPLIKSYLDSMDVELEQRAQFEKYLNFVSLRASGKLQTPATWIRNFVLNHDKYQQDSIVNEDIVYDLITTISDITNGKSKPKEMYGEF